MIHMPMRQAHAGQRRVSFCEYRQHGLRIVRGIDKHGLFGLRIDQDVSLHLVPPDVTEHRDHERGNPLRRRLWHPSPDGHRGKRLAFEGKNPGHGVDFVFRRGSGPLFQAFPLVCAKMGGFRRVGDRLPAPPPGFFHDVAKFVFECHGARQRSLPGPDHHGINID